MLQVRQFMLSYQFCLPVLHLLELLLLNAHPVPRGRPPEDGLRVSSGCEKSLDA